MFEQYKKEITAARELEQMGVLALMYEAIKADFYNGKILATEYKELKKMIFGF